MELRREADKVQNERPASEPIRVLHLSDLHLRGDRSVNELLQPLDADLRTNLRVTRLDYLVVSGDLTDKHTPQGFEYAEQFLQQVLSRFGLNANRLILVPGNHDVDLQTNPYRMELDEQKALKLPERQRVKQGELWLVRDDEQYPKRFALFRGTYQRLTKEEYPEALAQQGLIIPYPEDRIEFLTLNTAWEMDRWHKESISINEQALAGALLSKKRVAEAKLRIVVWHHAVAGNRKIVNDRTLEKLTQAGYRLCLHGDVHEERNDLMNHLDTQRSLHVVGVGAYSAADGGLPPGTPRIYNLLEISRDFQQIRVRSRAQRSLEGAFGPHTIYRQADDPDAGRGDYTIRL